MCVDWKTGKTIYDQRDAGRGSFTYAEGLIYFLAESGDFRLLRANPAKYDVIARWSIPENGEGLAWAHPVIFDKKLYIRHGTYLYCYDISRE